MHINPYNKPSWAVKITPKHPPISSWNMHHKYPKSTVHTSYTLLTSTTTIRKRRKKILYLFFPIDNVGCRGEKEESIRIRSLIGIFFVTSEISLFDDLFPPFPPEGHYCAKYPDRRKDRESFFPLSFPSPLFFFSLCVFLLSLEGVLG